MAELVRVEHLKKYFKVPKGTLCAVDGVSLSIGEGRTMGIVGESGCGKSTLGRTLLHLTDSTGGKFFFEGRDATKLGKAELRAYREKAQIIFQDPYSSLNPRQTVEDTIYETLLLAKRHSRAEIMDRITQVMEMVGIDSRLRLSYPHELDGGRRQRVGIARALALNPKFIVCDEPVSALDVSIQAQVLNLLQKLQREQGLAYMFITHDLSVVRHISNDIGVMYLGQLVETCPSKELFRTHYHPYTKALLSAIPTLDIHSRMKRAMLRGEIASPINPKPGCRFAERCPCAAERCQQPQALEEISPGHAVACCRARELNNLQAPRA
ncbi:MAG: ATP-binding cassette domain-containing protein [Clostridiales bacterium]|jgi:peptide/nickel transport system ATP-binding protein|nr:ATP-binding cassette domain-containing protein [Clostridiales bacterium]